MFRRKSPARRAEKRKPPKPLSTKLIPSKESKAAKSIFKTSSDLQFASTQLSIESLPRSQRASQESWAQSQLQKNLCIYRANLTFKRVYKGYLCSSKYHFVTHELIAEGKGGYYERWPWTRVDLKGKYNEYWLPYSWKGPVYRATGQQPHGGDQYRWYGTTRDVPALREGEMLGSGPLGRGNTYHRGRPEGLKQPIIMGVGFMGIGDAMVVGGPHAIPQLGMMGMSQDTEELSDFDEQTAASPQHQHQQDISRSTFTSDYDVQMASRQTEIETMDVQERQQQCKWARTQLNYNLGRCPAGLTWHRIKGAYRCSGGAHLVTDELLAEGRGGYYSANIHTGHWDMPWERVKWIGPRYRAVRDDESHDARVPRRVRSPVVGLNGYSEMGRGRRR